MEFSHLLLWAALCRSANDRVLKVLDMDTPVLCQDKEEQRPGLVSVSKV